MRYSVREAIGQLVKSDALPDATIKSLVDSTVAIVDQAAFPSGSELSLDACREEFQVDVDSEDFKATIVHGPDDKPGYSTVFENFEPEPALANTNFLDVFDEDRNDDAAVSAAQAAARLVIGSADPGAALDVVAATFDRSLDGARTALATDLQIAIGRFVDAVKSARLNAADALRVLDTATSDPMEVAVATAIELAYVQIDSARQKVLAHCQSE